MMVISVSSNISNLQILNFDVWKSCKCCLNLGGGIRAMPETKHFFPRRSSLGGCVYSVVTRLEPEAISISHISGLVTGRASLTEWSGKGTKSGLLVTQILGMLDLMSLLGLMGLVGVRCQFWLILCCFEYFQIETWYLMIPKCLMV